MAQTAAGVVQELCFGREETNETAAKWAMGEMIADWSSKGGMKYLRGNRSAKNERIGNYSVEYGTPQEMSVKGIPVSPAALIILEGAGLRYPGI